MSKYLSIGYRIASIRSMKHLTQTKFARSIGISQTFLSELENGITKPSMPILFAMEYKFGYTVEWILTGDQPMYKSEIGPPTILPLSGYETSDRVLLYWWNILVSIFEEGDKTNIEALKAQLRALDPAKKRAAQENCGQDTEKKAM